MKRFNDYRMRRVLVGFIVSGFLRMVPVCSALEYVWTQKADMPTPRWNLSTCTMDGTIYAIGGEPTEIQGSPWFPISAVEAYDPATDSWTKKADMPTARTLLSISAVGKEIYAIGGLGVSDTPFSCVEAYDPATDTWIRKTDMPTRRASLATVALDGKICAIGGYPYWGTWVGLRTVEAYDPATDTWTNKADMPMGVALLNARVVNGKIYAIGGRPDLKSRTYVQEYDPATDTWTRKADMPVGTSQMGSVVLGKKIIVIGGWLWSMDYPYKTVQMYDTQTDIWTIEGDAPFLRASFSAEVVNNRIYAIGGTDRPHPCPAFSTVYELTINPPPPDFNGDGVIDSKDVCIMIEYWGTNEALCDIAPPPFGDGVVDVEDLKVLAEHLFEDVNDPTLIAHWALDETEGAVAYDSAGENDASVNGEPVWKAEGGKVGGALAFDGVDDYVSTEPVLNPAESVFSVLAWVKGGARGQTILSQANGSNWLCLDSGEGCLMTELKAKGRGAAGPLLSQPVVTDGNWHRIGLVWDGSYRHLYVDGAEVAKDAAPLTDLESASGGLYFGVGSTLATGTFFSGLIDDIRIYDRVLHP